MNNERIIVLLMCLSLLCFLVPSFAEETSVTSKVTEVEKYGHAVLDTTIEDFTGSGFELGDIITVKTGAFERDMPFFNGYYVDRGQYMVRAYPGQNNIAVCINYGNFAETAGIDVGDPVTLTLKEKAGALTLQEISILCIPITGRTTLPMRSLPISALLSPESCTGSFLRSITLTTGPALRIG